MQTAHFRLVGTTPLMLSCFAALGWDHNAQFQRARYLAPDGWDGIPAIAFRAAIIGAARALGIATPGLSRTWVASDARATRWAGTAGSGKGFDLPIVRIIAAEPEPDIRATRSGEKLICRPRWDAWETLIRVSFDADATSELEIRSALQFAGQALGAGFTPGGGGRFETSQEAS